MPDLTIPLTQPPEFIKLLAHDLRWHLLKALTTSDQRVQELVALVGEPMNLVSYHLKKLRDDGVVSTRRSEADGRDVYYSLDMGRLHDLYQAAGAALHPALGQVADVSVAHQIAPKRVLFVCTHNSARSQMAEGLTSHAAGQQIEVHSAGSHPTRLHPDAIRAMDALGIDIRGQQSKHLHDFEGQTFDYVITVCDRAREICPVFPGEGAQIHWGFVDPTKMVDAAERRCAFDRIACQLTTRIEYFLKTLPTNESEI
jgi:ArsR family transcriptional regulator, arsenate/arsenite/antimonite-responsive transcriptional repressor / arsenate reductase (thioredoxin)